MIYIKKIRTFLIISCFSLIILLPQINQHALIIGGDSSFHWNRIYDAMMQIKNGNFQYFISMYGFSQSGRIVNALYGPYVAYFNGFIMLITGSWFKYQILSDWILNIIAAWSMYYLLISNKVKQNYSIWLSLLFVTSYSISTWTLNQQFLAWGTAIMPLGIAAASRMIRNRNNQISIIELTISVTLLIQTHILSAIFLIIILIIFFVFGVIISSNRWLMIKNIFISVILTILLTSNIWGSLLEVYGSNQLLAPFTNLYPLNNGVVQFLSNTNQLSIGFAIILSAQMVFCVCYYSKIALLNKLVTIVGSILFIMSTQLLPWNTIFTVFPLVSIIQFPYRLLAPATILLILGVGLSLTKLSDETIKKPDNKLIILGTLIVISTLVSLGNIQNKAAFWRTNEVVASRYNVTQRLTGGELRMKYRTQNMGEVLKYVWKPAPDYLPRVHTKNSESPYRQYQKEIETNNNFIKKTENSKLIISWTSKNTNPIIVSVVKYRHTKLTLNRKMLKNSDYTLSGIGAIQLTPKIGRNALVVEYVPSYIFRLLMIVNAISWIGVLGWSGIWFKKRLNSN